ncbi:MAG: hypothetical protein H9535_08735 [Ignavibacteria bacterium]|nr:hypothetical protein [Ignavibacteria bacterium]
MITSKNISLFVSVALLFTILTTHALIAQVSSKDSASAIQAIKTKPVLKENQYLIRSGTEEKIITDVFTARDGFQKTLVQKHGVEKEFNEIYNTLLRGVIQQDKSVTNSYKNLLEDPQTLQELTPEEARKVSWRLSTEGYTMETINQFQQISGLNLINIFARGTSDVLLRRTLFASQIVIGTIDSIFFDSSIQDGEDHSMLISVKETLKGDTAIKHLIIRESGRSHAFIPRKKATYLLFLEKSRYEFSTLQSHGQPQTGIVKSLSNASDINLLPHFSTQRENLFLALENKPIPPLDKAILLKRVYDMCKEYAPVFQKLNSR